MNSIEKARSISIWIFVVPFVAVNICLILVTQFHSLFPNQTDILHNTIPYFDGGASISRTARPYPSWLVFKPAMFLTSYLLIRYWLFNKDIIKYFEVDHKNLKAYANPAQLKRVTVLLSIPALVNHTDKVEKTKSIGNPDEKPSIIIFNGFSVKKNKKFLFNYFLQKDGKKIISIAKISSLPKIIPTDSNHLD